MREAMSAQQSEECLQINRPQVVILLGAPFTEQNVERIGLHTLEQQLDVHIIDCARLIGRNPDAIQVQLAEWPRYNEVSTPEALRQILQACAATWAIDNIGLDVDTIWIGDLLKELRIGLVGVKSGLLPRPSLRDRLRAFLLRRGEAALPHVISGPSIRSHGDSRIGRLASLWRKVCNRVSYEKQRRSRIPAPDLVLLAGSDALYAQDVKAAATRIWIASEDYYTFQKVVSQEDVQRKREPYVLFIDVCLPFATDWKFLGIDPPITAEEYYPLLRRLFDRIEKLWGMPVVVAGHPNSSSILEYANLIGARKLIMGKTAELVLQAELVLTHASTATSYVALAAKPSVFVSSLGIDQTYYGSRVRALAASLGSPLVMLEDSSVLLDTMLPRQPNEAACRIYIDRYLRSKAVSEVEQWSELINHILRNPHGPNPSGEIVSMRQR